MRYNGDTDPNAPSTDEPGVACPCCGLSTGGGYCNACHGAMCGEQDADDKAAKCRAPRYAARKAVLTSTEMLLMDVLTDLLYRIERSPETYALLKFETDAANKVVAGIDAAAGATAKLMGRAAP